MNTIYGIRATTGISPTVFPGIGLAGGIVSSDFEKLAAGRAMPNREALFLCFITTGENTR